MTKQAELVLTKNQSSVLDALTNAHQPLGAYALLDLLA